MTRPVLLLVESNTTGSGRQFARCAADLGLRPVLVGADPGRYPYAAEDGLRVEVADTSDERAVLAVARSLDREAGLAGVTSSSEYFVATAAAVARAFGLPGPDAAAVRACRNKGRQRALLQAGGVPVPRFALVRNQREAVLAAEEIGYPVVLKPVLGSGSLGVRLCADPDAAAAHAAALTSAAVDGRVAASARDVLVEEYLRGAEYSVEVFGRTVVVVVAKQLGPLPDFVEYGHVLPAALPAGDSRRLGDTAVRAVQALGLGWGAAHVELRQDGDDVHVIEVNPRLAGGMIPDLAGRALGVDLVACQVRAAVGLAPALRPAGTPRAAAIRFLTADAPGALAGADARTAALDAALATAGVEAAALYRGPGEAVAPAHDFRGRIGHVIAVAPDTSAAARAAAQGLGELSTALDHSNRGGTDRGGTNAARTKGKTRP
ncbi:ATP-grasp domain-containing protein [Streptomyces sp. NPDC059538]|uniref:ATP-grasp domain-containing protein n=1 Tax=Streptomyces sp. NPDC059538 TaxID=3346860 RepID=UPI003697DEFD